MNISIKVPALGESISEATIASWHVQEGDFVKKDQVVCELETDKVTLEVTAPETGQIVAIKQAADATVTIDAVLAEMVAKAFEPTAEPTQEKEEDPLLLKEKSKKEEMPKAPASAVKPAPTSQEKVRTTKEDLIKNAKSPSPQPASFGPQPVNSNPDREALEGEEKVKMTRLRQVISKRLKEAQNTAAMLTTFNEVDMGAVMALRKKHQDRFVKNHEIKLGFMSFFVKASVEALKEFPAVNAEIAGENIIFKNNYHIGVAVGTENGLVVPVIHDADQMNFAEVEKNIADYGQAARSGKLSPKDMQGGTFTITNGGIYGSLLSTPILNTPQSGILGMHGIKQRPMVMEDGSIEARPMMYLALTYDHRIIDGKEAVSFLVRIKEMIENPETILLGV